MKPRLVVIAGPTAVGKTRLAVELAKRIDGEIISADSMQVYKHMDIGTAKPTAEEMGGIPHYLIDEVEPWEEYSAAIFAQKAKLYLERIYARGKAAIIAGGTGFYVNALVYDNDFGTADADAGIRAELYAYAQIHGALALHDMLRQADPCSAERIHPNNVKRVVRAIEFHRLFGESISRHNDLERGRVSPYDAEFFILFMPREKLYRRIEQRVDNMVRDGLVGEVQKLLDMGVSPDAVSMRGQGYKEIVPYLQGRAALEECVQTLKRNTRRFAKRQITWFKHQSVKPSAENSVTEKWIDVDEDVKLCIIEDIIRMVRKV
ncbi:MAG: tRNA (adenosine(37)-N6)-dimethylallyltransferase MiaA [Defluviitaleaceae bacterium]|nr:tRNA (adenosine(37)-N6)-dimethylallyltransferase MiaA [Defluviitaleaceae bacterium]